MKSTRIVPVLLSFFIASLISVQAQTPDLLPGELFRQSGRFYEGSEEIDRRVFWEKVENHPEAGIYYKKGTGQEAGGTILLGTGGLLLIGGAISSLGNSVSNALSGGERKRNTGAGIAIVGGLGSLIGGIVLLSSGKKNVERAIDTYNRFEVDQKRIGFGIGPNGLGIRINLNR